MPTKQITKEVLMDYSNYNSSFTQAYKNGYIHSACFGNIQVIRVQVDKYAYVIQVKSFHHAKILITAHEKNYGKKS
jgi:hypothetical protein